MTTLTIEKEPRALNLGFDQSTMSVFLKDRRTLVIPLDWYPRLAYALPTEQNSYELWDEGAVLVWPQLDEHIDVKALLAGRPSAEGATSLARWKEKLNERRLTQNSTEWVVAEPLPDWWPEKG